MQDVKHRALGAAPAGNATGLISSGLQDVNAPQPPNGANDSSEPQQPQSEFHILLAFLLSSPVDPEGWNKLIRLAEDSSDITQIKKAYDSLLKVYPNTVRSFFIN